MDPVVVIFVVLLVVVAGVIGLLVFGGWVIVATLRLIGRVLGVGGAGAARPPLPPVALRHRRCAHANCAAYNVPSARFCRRCGRAVGAGEVAVVRRVAMW
jgi:hypothetical protein